MGTSCYRVYSKVEDLQGTIEKWRRDEKKELWLLCWIGIRGRQLTGAVEEVGVTLTLGCSDTKPGGWYFAIIGEAKNGFLSVS
jgi:hypothetical protein